MQPRIVNIISKIHLNARTNVPCVPTFALLFEPSSVFPLHKSYQALSKYQHLFTWSSNIYNLFPSKTTVLPIPHHLTHSCAPDYSHRKLFSVMISANKASRNRNIDTDLYSERIKDHQMV